MFIGLCVLVVCIAGPLGLVWKQSYINQVSIRLETKTEELRALNLEIKSLSLMCHRLAEPERVERIARSQGFEYPASKQLEVLEVSVPRRERGIGGFFAGAAQSLLGKN
jgi:cell division protein FtsL